MSVCDNCMNFPCGEEKTSFISCYFYEHKKTNADRIRAMTDEELADWVWGAETVGRAYGPRGKAAWLNWLKQEVSDDS